MLRERLGAIEVEREPARDPEVVREPRVQDPVEREEEAAREQREDEHVALHRVPHLVREDRGELPRVELRQEEIGEEHDAHARAEPDDRGVRHRAAGAPHEQLARAEPRLACDGLEQLAHRPFGHAFRLPRVAEQRRQQRSEHEQHRGREKSVVERDFLDPRAQRRKQPDRECGDVVHGHRRERREEHAQLERAPAPCRALRPERTRARVEREHLQHDVGRERERESRLWPAEERLVVPGPALHGLGPAAHADHERETRDRRGGEKAREQIRGAEASTRDLVCEEAPERERHETQRERTEWRLERTAPAEFGERERDHREHDVDEVAHLWSPLRAELAIQTEYKQRVIDAETQVKNTETAFNYRYQIITPPELPTAPVSGSLSSIIISIIGAGIVGAALTTMIDLLRGRVVEAWQVSRRLNLPVLAELKG